MAEATPSRTAQGAADLELDEEVTAALRLRLTTIAEETVAAVMVEVPSYAGALSGQMGENIEGAVQMALSGFLKLASGSRGSDASTPLGPALEAAYSLGRGEARSGRSMDALLAAYRVGARVAWREMADEATAAGIAVETMAKFAELVFAYIDELSAASVAGHTDELSTTGRVRERYLERLGHHLLSGASADVLAASAERASWTVPDTLTAVLLPAAHVRGVTRLLGQGTLHPEEDLPGLEDDDETDLLLVPDLAGHDRQWLLGVLSGRHAVVGPSRPWRQVRSSYQRALRGLAFGVPGDEDSLPVDTERHLVDLVLGADPEALADLRTQALAPLSKLRPATAERLKATLRSWLLHQGRRDDVAADLFVHAQTVRYRMGQVRELYGDRLDDPQAVLELTVALGTEPGVAHRDEEPRDAQGSKE